ncbi:HNH endonuclease signature motif containing protein [Pseudomonas sp. GV071]|uniref:HNH endonuclease signature motif containing protein n=1 Tax=Pseudomonas sp. GV071 TaxID=2135754 RepID=UPI000D33C62D|nr:HNH endonuclease signature motif containing protein [Pseudomonas sp. GV071]PTQ70388.1 HNH endonuclease [Pseudomonas sp. GV071]
MNPLAAAALSRARAKISRAQWSSEEDATLRELYPAMPMRELTVKLRRTSSSIYQRARALGLYRSPEYMASEHACRLRRGDSTGEAFRFKKGQQPWNAGMKGLQLGGRCQETQFKPGKNPHNWNPIGHERVTKDGYLQRKMTDTKCTPKDYRMVHHLVWEEANGPVPPGHAVVFIDRDKNNLELANLELVTRAELCRRNSIHRYPPELKELIRLQKKLERTIRKRRDEESNDRSA